MLAALARAAEQLIGELNEQNLANSAWAFATVGEPAPTMLDLVSVGPYKALTKT